jgi:hypothetical protein
MKASQKPQLSFTEDAQGRRLWAIGDRLSQEGPDVNPEGVARLHVMINLVLPRLTKS